MPDCGLPLPCESTVAVNGDALTIANDGGGGAITAFADNGTFGVRAAGRAAGVFAIGLENGVGVLAQSTGVEGGDSTGTGVEKIGGRKSAAISLSLCASFVTRKRYPRRRTPEIRAISIARL
jgi:hypothetical protein